MANRFMRFLIISFLLFMIGNMHQLSMASALDKLPKIVSLNMCVDPYLMAFAAPEQIIALAPQSHQSDLSPFTEQAKNFPISDGTIENILQLQPDLVIGSPFNQHLKRQILEAQGIIVLTIEAHDNYASARQEIMSVGRAIGRLPQAAAYLRQLDAALKQAHRSDQSQPQNISILPLQRRGLTIGDTHILGDIIKLSGARLAHSDNRRTQTISPISLEEAVMLESDFILTTDDFSFSKDRGIEFLHHPALARHYGAAQRLHLPTNLIICAGATTPLAVQTLKTQLLDYSK